MKLGLLAFMLTALPVAAVALEPIPDASLADTVGQSGLTVTLSSLNVTADNVRYYDSNGIAGSPTYGSPGAIDYSNVNFSVPGPVSFTLDVGSTGRGASAVSGILLGISGITGMSLTTGPITVDSGTELAAAGTPTTISSGLSLTNIDISNLAFLITPGSPVYNSGITLTPLTPISFSLNFNVQDPVNGGVFSGDFGVRGFSPGYIAIDVGPSGSSQNDGLDIYMGNNTLDAIWLSSVRIGAGVGSSAPLGSFYLSNVVMASSVISIVGH